MDVTPNPSKRRIFLRTKGESYFLFNFDQRADGSIYTFSPDFHDAKWMTLRSSTDGYYLESNENLGEGKISLHGSGMTAVRPYGDQKGHRLIVHGNQLMSRQNKQLGTRHLFTALMKQPHSKPPSSAFNRESDYALESNGALDPFVLIFFAVPKGLSVNFKFSLHIDDLVEIPNDFLGAHIFSLRFHSIFWFAYRTKHMSKWTKQLQICYHDGFTVPIFIGQGEGKGRLEFRHPEYFMRENEIEIQCNGPDSDII